MGNGANGTKITISKCGMSLGILEVNLRIGFDGRRLKRGMALSVGAGNSPGGE